VRVAARSWLVAVCSGTVLVVGGVLILVWRPPLRLLWVAAMALCLAVATLLHPDLTFLVVQSAMIGVLLTVLLAAIQWVVEGRRSGSTVYGEAGPLAPGLATAGSTLSRIIGVGSDDSTAIRTRPVPTSTVDHVPTKPLPPPESAALGSPRAERAGRGGSGP
jgi:hypothetical protein